MAGHLPPAEAPVPQAPHPDLCCRTGKLCQHHAQLHRRPCVQPSILCRAGWRRRTTALIPERCRCAAQSRPDNAATRVQPDDRASRRSSVQLRCPHSHGAGPYACPAPCIAEGAPTRIKQLPYPAQCPARGAVIAAISPSSRPRSRGRACPRRSQSCRTSR